MMKYPNVWGRGALFTFSGIDAECKYSDSMCGKLLSENIGFSFDDGKVKLYLHLAKETSTLEFKVVASDIIEGKLNSDKFGFYFVDMNTVAGYSPKSISVPCCNADTLERSISEDCLIFFDGEFYYCFAKIECDENFYFVLSRNRNRDFSLKHTLEMLNVDFSELSFSKLAFFDNLPAIKTKDEITERTLAKCFSVLKSQVYSAEGKFFQRWTTPDKFPHKMLWLWDSIFHSFGNVYIEPRLAYDSIVSVLDTQNINGCIPHRADPFQFSDITQPPIIAWGLFKLYEKTGKVEWLIECFDDLKKYLEWNMEKRDSNRNYLYEWVVQTDNPYCRCDECGMDNSPRFDDVKKMDCIDFSCYMANEMRYMAKICEVLNLPEASYYEDLFEKIKNAVNKELYDAEDGRYYDREVESGKIKKVSAISSFLPLFSGICDRDRADKLVADLVNPETFGTEIPIPSVSRDDETFGSDMWRGPVWVNYNFMIYSGLCDYGYSEVAKSIAKKTVTLITEWYEKDGTVYEFYDSENKKSPAVLYRKGAPVRPFETAIKYETIRDYGWTASIFVALINELNQ